MTRRTAASTIIAITILLAASPRGDTAEPRPLPIGQSCALTGPGGYVGQDMRIGLNACFERVNAQGGIDGRPIELRTINDWMETPKCRQAVRTLIDENVLAIIGGTGIETTAAAAPICAEAGVPYLAPASGAAALSASSGDWTINLRCSFDQEIERLCELLVDTRGLQRIACFHENDAHGQEGLAGLQRALKRRGMQVCSSGSFEPDTVAVAGGLRDVAKGLPEAIVMIGPSRGLAAFIKATRANTATRSSTLCAISSVDGPRLCAELGSAGEGCVVSQVVPYPHDATVPLVAEYQRDMRAVGRTSHIGFASLEGYLAGRMLCAAMRRIDGPVTREALAASLRSGEPIDLGGVTLQFGPGDNRGLEHAYLTVIRSGELVSGDSRWIAEGDADELVE